MKKKMATQRQKAEVIWYTKRYNKTNSTTMRTPLSIATFEQYLREVEPLKEGFDLLKFHTVITDANGNILYANKAVESQTGYARAEMLGKNPGDLWGGKMEEETYKKMWHTMKTSKEPFMGEIRNTRKDGTTYWQELYISPILDDHGEVKFFVGIEPNITNRKRQEQFREEFAAMLAHQSKKPLTAMHWVLELLLDYGNLNPEQAAQLKDVFNDTENLIDLINDLLLLSRIEGDGESKKEEERFDLREEIEHILSAIQKRHNTVSFTFTHSDSPFEIVANKIFTQQIFANLIANAAEYADASNPTVSLLLTSTDYTYEFTVTNNGLGIREQDKQKIFGRFFRTEEAKKIKSSGSGLGLYIVKLLCDRFAWKVWFESPPGDGAGVSFFVSLPKKRGGGERFS